MLSRLESSLLGSVEDRKWLFPMEGVCPVAAALRMTVTTLEALTWQRE